LLATKHIVVLLVDETEQIAPKRGRFAQTGDPHDYLAAVTQFIRGLDDLRTLSKGVVVFISNHPEMVDEAVLSRIDLTLTFDSPNADACALILEDTFSVWRC